MSAAFQSTVLPDRGVVALTGPEAMTFLDRLIPVDLDRLKPASGAFSGLLSPQGKILVEFFVVPTPDGLLLDTRAADVTTLIKRPTLYKLRAAVTVQDRSAVTQVIVAPTRVANATGDWIADPRHPDLGWRGPVADVPADMARDASAYHRHRINLGVPEGGLDYPLGDSYPHEANYDRVGAVSFTKGCFVGQEVVARMQHKTVVRKRVVPLMGTQNLASGAAIRIGEAEIGRVGSVAETRALGLLRVDRAAEARTAQQPLPADGVALTVDATVLDDYVARAASTPKIDL